jgi:hypothetical protein
MASLTEEERYAHTVWVLLTTGLEGFGGAEVVLTPATARTTTVRNWEKCMVIEYRSSTLNESSKELPALPGMMLSVLER